MKFIGQYIQQFIARFRSDVYLESLSDTSETGVLVVDSAGKISKNAGISGGVASTVTVTNDTSFTDFPIVFHNESNGLLDSQNFKYNPGTQIISTSGTFIADSVVQGLGLLAGSSGISSTSTNASAPGPVLNFIKNRNGASAVNNDEAGEIQFNGVNDAGTPQSIMYAQILSSSALVTDGDERGKLELKVANDGTLRNGITFLGTDTAQEVDVTIGNGDASLTTIAGKLRINSGIDCDGNDLIITNSDIALGSNVGAPIDGFIGFVDAPMFASQATSGPLFTIKNQKNDANGAILRFVKDKGAAGAIHDNLGNIEFYGDDALQQQTLFAKIHSKIVSATNGQEGGKLSLGVASHDGVFRDAISIIDTGVADPSIMLEAAAGGKIVSRTEETLITWGEDGLTGLFANANLDIGDYDFKAQTLTSDVATGTAPFTVSSTTQVANLNAATAGTATTATTATTANALASGTSTGDTFTFTSANANDPLFIIQNTTNDGNGPKLRLFNNKGAAGIDDEYSGTIEFNALNDGSSEVNLGSITCQMTTSSAGSEDSNFQFGIKDGDGTSRNVLELEKQTSVVRSDNLRVTGDLAIDGGNITTAVEVDGLLTAGANIRVGGSGRTSNNWITIDAQAGNDSSGGGVVFYETQTDTLGSPQYGAKIVYNEVEDEFAIGTMQNTAFKRQIYMPRESDHVFFADAAYVEGASPSLQFQSTDTSIVSTNSLGDLNWKSADDGGVTLQLRGIATQTHSSNSAGGSKFEFHVTPNNTTATTLAATIDQNKSLTVEGDLQVNGNNVFANSIIETNDFNTTTFENIFPAYRGKIIKYSPGSSTNLNAAQIYYLDTDGEWKQTDADDVAKGGYQMLGVGLGANPQTGVFTEGYIRIASTEILNTPGSGAVDGLPLYVSTTAGHFDFTAPSGNNDFVRIVGYAIDDHSGDVLVYFNPDKSWVEVTVGG